jgi:hypothetical protein
MEKKKNRGILFFRCVQAYAMILYANGNDQKEPVARRIVPARNIKAIRWFYVRDTSVIVRKRWSTYWI